MARGLSCSQTGSHDARWRLSSPNNQRQAAMSLAGSRVMSAPGNLADIVIWDKDPIAPTLPSCSCSRRDLADHQDSGLSTEGGGCRLLREEPPRARMFSGASRIAAPRFRDLAPRRWPQRRFAESAIYASWRRSASSLSSCHTYGAHATCGGLGNFGERCGSPSPQHGRAVSCAWARLAAKLVPMRFASGGGTCARIHRSRHDGQGHVGPFQ